MELINEKMQLLNDCKKKPPLLFWHIRKVLKWISPVDLIGIEYIRLENNSPQLFTDPYHNSKHLRDLKPLGMYFPQTPDSLPFITLYIDELYYPIPYLAYYSPMTTLLIAKTLAHEVAHHLVRTKGYIFSHDEKYPSYERSPEYEEEMATRFAFETVRKMKKKLIYKLGAYMMKSISEWYYAVAVAKWDNKNYKATLDYCWKAFLLNNDSKEAINGYWLAIGKLESMD